MPVTLRRCHCANAAMQCTSPCPGRKPRPGHGSRVAEGEDPGEAPAESVRREQPGLRHGAPSVAAGDDEQDAGLDGASRVASAIALAGLIAGTLTPRAGEVRLGGVPQHRVGQPALTSHRVLIPQEASLRRHARQDLTYLNPQATPAGLDEAAGLVGLRSLVTRLGGYGAYVDPASIGATYARWVRASRRHRLCEWHQRGCVRRFSRLPGTGSYGLYRPTGTARRRFPWPAHPGQRGAG